MLGTSRRMVATLSEAARKMLAANVYVSEGRDAKVLAELEQAARATQGVALVHSFVDQPYHRTGYTLASSSQQALASAVVTLSEASVARVDLRRHQASHPRLGAVDHISFHPVGPGLKIGEASKVANAVGAELGSKLGLPVCLYGAAHPKGRPLSDVRRALGYFENKGLVVPETAASDYGPKEVTQAAGVVCVGAMPWMVNYNVLLLTSDMTAARKIARGVSTRGGGLPHVQAMALEHEGGIEVACNLLHPAASGSAAVLLKVEELAAEAGLKVSSGYETGITATKIMQIAEHTLGGQ